jgi:peptidoglycan/xylan/chitin deacetylase (PgdA/CDA1 family)
MYHSFTENPAGLRNQCEHIRRYYCPVSMAQVAESLATGEELPPNALAVTVDDGYRDFSLYGYPVFQEFGIAPTVYLVSDFLDRKCWLWWNEIQYAIERSRNCTIRIAIGEHNYDLPVTTEAEKARSSELLIEDLKSLPNQDREEAKARILHSLDVPIPPDPPAKWEPLAWEEVRRLSESGVEFGAHTRTHPILASLRESEQVREQIAGCKQRLERALGRAVLHFSYPNGRTQDIGAVALQETHDCGFRTAVTTEPGMNDLTRANPLVLRRLGVDTHLSNDYFAELLAGVRNN